MKVEIKKMTCEDLLMVSQKKDHKVSVLKYTDAQARWVENTPYARSLFIDGELVMCGGVTEYWKNRGEAWGVIDPTYQKNFFVIHGAVKRFLDECPIVRIEASIDCGFKKGKKFVESLGFKLEAPILKHFLPDGHDASLYCKIKEGAVNV